MSRERKNLKSSLQGSQAILTSRLRRTTQNQLNKAERARRESEDERLSRLLSSFQQRKSLTDVDATSTLSSKVESEGQLLPTSSNSSSSSDVSNSTNLNNLPVDADLNASNQSNASDVDSDNQSIASSTSQRSTDGMASSYLAPDSFAGLTSEDPVSWLRDVEHWVAFKKLDAPGVLGLIPLLLKNSAKIWYEKLENGKKDTFEHFKAAFNEKYKVDESQQWFNVASIWSTSQKDGQSVDEFINEVERKAMNVSADEDHGAVMNGLRPEIRQMVLQHEPFNDLQQIRRWAMIAETSGGAM